jgi:thioredoxin-related protein
MRHQKILLTLFGLISLILSSATHAGQLNFFTGTSVNLKQESELATEQSKKGLLIFYSTPVCPFCKRMKKTVLNQPEVQHFFKENFRTIDLNILDKRPISNFSGNQTTPSEFAKSNRIRVTPTLIFYDLEGERLFKQVGIIVDSQEFIWLGEFVLEERYNHESFVQFKRKKRTRH